MILAFRRSVWLVLFGLFVFSPFTTSSAEAQILRRLLHRRRSVPSVPSRDDQVRPPTAYDFCRIAVDREVIVNGECIEKYFKVKNCNDGVVTVLEGACDDVADPNACTMTSPNAYCFNLDDPTYRLSAAGRADCGRKILVVCSGHAIILQPILTARYRVGDLKWNDDVAVEKRVYVRFKNPYGSGDSAVTEHVAELREMNLGTGDRKRRCYIAIEVADPGRDAKIVDAVDVAPIPLTNQRGVVVTHSVNNKPHSFVVLMLKPRQP